MGFFICTSHWNLDSNQAKDKQIWRLYNYFFEYEATVHVLWECPAHSHCRLTFLSMRPHCMCCGNVLPKVIVDWCFWWSYIVREIKRVTLICLVILRGLHMWCVRGWFQLFAWYSWRFTIYVWETCCGTHPIILGWSLSQDDKLQNGRDGQIALEPYINTHGLL